MNGFEKPIKSNKQKVKEYTEISSMRNSLLVLGKITCIHLLEQ